VNTLRGMRLKDLLLVEYDHEVGTTKRLIERAPEDQLAWKPHDRSMSLGGLATHLGQIVAWSGPLLNDTSFDLAQARPPVEAHTSRAAIVDAFDRTTAEARRSMDKTDAEYESVWTLKRDGHVLFTLPRIVAFRSFVLSHMIHHRGQLSVYLRLLNVPVPAIYGPTADEG
jgi:uncharacterized damage-inducible protein DinB